MTPTMIVALQLLGIVAGFALFQMCVGHYPRRIRKAPSFMWQHGWIPWYAYPRAQHNDHYHLYSNSYINDINKSRHQGEIACRI